MREISRPTPFDDDDDDDDDDDNDDDDDDSSLMQQRLRALVITSAKFERCVKF